MYTWQQARAQIVRAALHSYSRDDLAERIKRLAPDSRISNQHSILSLAYKLAWLLLPAGSDRGAL